MVVLAYLKKFFSKKKNEQQDKKTVIYGEKEFLLHTEIYLELYTNNLKMFFNFKDFYEYLSYNIVDIIIIMLPEEKIYIQKYKDIFNFSKEKNINIKIIVFDQHKFADIFFQIGIDYYIVTDNFSYFNKNIEYDYFLKNKSYSIVNVNILENILYKIFNNVYKNQDIKSLIIEKEEFYNSVVDIFKERAKDTADIKKEINYIKKQLESYNSKNILDGGCGMGRISQKIADLGYRVVGVDISEELIKIANKNKKKLDNPNYFKMNLLKTGFRNKEFDTIFLLWHVICELKEYHEELIKEMYRLLKFDGILIIDFPDINKNSNIKKTGEYSHNVNNLIKYRGIVPQIDNFLVLIESLGFKIKEVNLVHWGINKFVIILQKK